MGKEFSGYMYNCCALETTTTLLINYAQSPSPTLYDSMTAAHQAFLSLTVSQTLPKFIHVRCVGDVIRPSHPLTPSSPSALDLSQQLTRFQYKKVKQNKTKQQPTNQKTLLSKDAADAVAVLLLS